MNVEGWVTFGMQRAKPDKLPTQPPKMSEPLDEYN
jgi:hypothetical protein